MSAIRTVAGDTVREGLYLYRDIRTAGGRALNAERQLELLCASVRALGGIVPHIDGRQLAAAVRSLLESGGYPENRPSCVTVRCYLSGEVEIAGREVLASPRRALRRVFPRGAMMTWEVPFGCEWSSLSLAADAAARMTARLDDEDVAAVIRLNAEGLATTAGDAPLFVIRDDKVFTPSCVPVSDEYELAAAAIAAADLALERCDITAEMIDEADEVFFCDWRGVTALATCGSSRYMHLLAERIGNRLVLAEH